MKIMVDLDRVVFDCPSFMFWIGNIFCTKRYEDKELSYHLINEEEAKTKVKIGFCLFRVKKRFNFC